MPSKSAQQHNLMEKVAHDPEAAKRVGVPQKVGRDFVRADKSQGSPYKTAARGRAREDLQAASHFKKRK